MGIHTDVMTFHMNEKWHSFWNGRTEKIDGIKVIRIPGLDWLPLEHSPRFTFRVNLSPGRFAHHLRNYDIIHFHDDGDFSFSLFSYFAKRPKLLHLHSFRFELYRENPICRQILKRVANIYIALSRVVERDLLRIGLRREKIRRLPNGVDTNKYHPSGRKEENLVLWVGRITRIKGIHVLLRSLAS